MKTEVASRGPVLVVLAVLAVPAVRQVVEKL